MHILLVAATQFETELLMTKFSFLKMGNLYSYYNENNKIDLLITGVGSVNTTFHLQNYLQKNNPGIAIQLGVAGVRNYFVELGKCFFIAEDCFADIGVFEFGAYKNLFDMNLMNADENPFIAEKLMNNTKFEILSTLNLKKANARTVNLIESDENRLKLLNDKYNSDAESMEGAAFHFVMLQTKIPFVQLRSASNFIGERNKSNWRMKLAIDEINKLVLEIIEQHYFIKQRNA